MYYALISVFPSPLHAQLKKYTAFVVDRVLRINIAISRSNIYANSLH